MTGETELPAAARFAAGGFSFRETVRVASSEAVTFLPAWMYLVYGCLLLNTELTNVDPPRYDLVPTVVFPLAVFILFSAARAFGSVDLLERDRLRFFVINVTLAIALPLLTLAFHRPSPLTRDGLLMVYEFSNFIWAGLLIWHAWKHERSHVTLFFGAGLLYGMVLENSGIVMGFFHETNLTRTQVPPFVAPVATVVGWSVVLYMSTFVVWKLRTWVPVLKRSTVVSALLTGGLATMLDLQIDPIATATGCWVWHESLPAWFYGVPLVNFVAWVSALTPFAYVMFRIQDLRGLVDGAAWPRAALRQLLMAIPFALVTALALFLSATVIIEGAFGPSWEIMNRFVLKSFNL